MILSFNKEIKNRRNIIETDFTQRNPTPRGNTNIYANSQMQAIVDNYYDTSWSRIQVGAKKMCTCFALLRGRKKVDKPKT